MTRFYFFVLTLFISNTYLSAQHTHNALCGHNLVLEQLKKKFPEYKDHEEKFFKDMAKKAKELRGKRTDETLVIPLVIHVVWRDPSENIHDSLIQAQVRILNEDFSRTNPDADNIREIFGDIVASPNVRFELVEVKRIQTNATFEISLLTGALPDNVKENSRGGSNAVDTDTHLNLWICKIQPITFLGITVAQILGYAYPPAGLANWPEGVSAPRKELDGVVVDYRMISDKNPFPIDIGDGNPLTVKGRTATHEVGHYLGLRHIWGDGGGPLGLEDSCNEDDGIEDTPNQGFQSNFSCDFTQNTCIDDVDDLPDMIENFMDYASEDCMNSFTQGQVDIMRTVLFTQRNKLVSSVNDVVKGVNWKIVPNPANNAFSVIFPENSVQNFSYSIYNSTGVLIKKDNSSQGENINADYLSSGLYFIVIENGDKITTQRLMIQK